MQTGSDYICKENRNDYRHPKQEKMNFRQSHQWKLEEADISVFMDFYVSNWGNSITGSTGKEKKIKQHKDGESRNFKDNQAFIIWI